MFISVLWQLIIPNLSYAETQVNDLTIKQTEDKTSVILKLSGMAHYHIELGNPHRVALNFTDAHLAFAKPKLLENSAIQSIQISGKQRIIFVLKEFQTIKGADLKQVRSGYTLTLHFTGRAMQKAASLREKYPEKKRFVQEKKVILPPAFKTAKPSKQGHRRILTVVIDPGHGGKDPGAIGKQGTHEKEVVLAIAKQLQTQLNRIPSVKAILTRQGDHYLELRDRMLIARRHKADFFLAIHADAYKNSFASGASVFALSERGATSEAARWLAEKENYSELGDVKLNDKSRMLRSVLLDLSQTSTISQSLDVGSTILHELSKTTHLHHGFVEQARFVVLKSPDIPSLLVETGFLSNPLEEKRLKQPDYQKRLANALMLGLNRYFQTYNQLNDI